SSALFSRALEKRFPQGITIPGCKNCPTRFSEKADNHPSTCAARIQVSIRMMLNGLEIRGMLYETLYFYG
ncbi:MAG: hypothetical protein SV201_04255, partial [Pseudomonadota bacterium]|nr:hypothetical protein [Pseudomonadota bacterium]